MTTTSWTQYLPEIAPELVARHDAEERARRIELLRAQLEQEEARLLTDRAEVEKHINAMWDSSEIAAAKRAAMLDMWFYSSETGDVTGGQLMPYLSKFGPRETEAIQIALGSLCEGQGFAVPVTAPFQLACPMVIRRRQRDAQPLAGCQS